MAATVRMRYVSRVTTTKPRSANLPPRERQLLSPTSTSNGLILPIDLIGAGPQLRLFEVLTIAFCNLRNSLLLSFWRFSTTRQRPLRLSQSVACSNLHPVT